MRSIQCLLVIALGVCCCQVACATSAELCSYPGISIPDGGGTDMYAVDTLYFGSNLVIEDVKVDVEITHAWIGDLAIGVLSPAGTVVGLYDGAGEGDIDIDVIFSDAGSTYDSESWVCGCEVMPSGPGTLADFDGEASAGYWSIAVFDFVVDYSGTLDSWCISAEGCTIYAPNTVDCSVESGTRVVLWDTVDPVPDELVLYRDGTVLAYLDADATRYEEEGELPPGFYFYELEAQMDGCASIVGSCERSEDGVTVCRDGTGTVLDAIGDMYEEIISGIDYTEEFTAEEVTVFVEVTHSWAGDLVITVESPDAVTVTLFDKALGSPDTGEEDMSLTFADHAARHGSVPLTCGCTMEPVIDGSMSDLVGQSVTGFWILRVGDPVPGYDGMFLDWCLTAYERGPTFLRGDADGNGLFSGLSDSLYLLHYAFTGGTAPPCLEAADADANGSVNGLLDALRMLNHAFTGGTGFAEPYPFCGTAELLIGCDVEPDCS